MGEVDLYSRENLEGFFKWQETPLEHFLEEFMCEDKASEFARSKPRANGYITFKSKWRGKRYFWIQNGQASELDPMECYLKVKDSKLAKAKDRIHRTLFRR